MKDSAAATYYGDVRATVSYYPFRMVGNTDYGAMPDPIVTEQHLAPKDWDHEWGNQWNNEWRAT